MGLRINTNVASLTAQRNLGIASEALSRNFEHLSTGKRISRASDDAAGLAIASRLGASIRSTDQAVRNANDGISLVQTAEGGLSELEGTITRMRELAVQSSNGTNSPSDRSNLNSEFVQLQAAIDQISQSTNFNNISLLNTSSAITLQIGPGVTPSTDSLSVSLANVTGSSLSLNTLDISTVLGATQAIAALDTALNTVTTARGNFGALQNRLNATISSLQIRSENLSAAKSRIEDVDIAAETALLTKHNILQQSALSVLAQANSQPSAALRLLQG